MEPSFIWDHIQCLQEYQATAKQSQKVNGGSEDSLIPTRTQTLTLTDITLILTQVRQLVEQALFQGADEEKDTSPDSKASSVRGGTYWRPEGPTVTLILVHNPNTEP